MTQSMQYIYVLFVKYQFFWSRWFNQTTKFHVHWKTWIIMKVIHKYQSHEIQMSTNICSFCQSTKIDTNENKWHHNSGSLLYQRYTDKPCRSVLSDTLYWHFLLPPSCCILSKYQLKFFGFTRLGIEPTINDALDESTRTTSPLRRLFIARRYTDMSLYYHRNVR
jgi:hypothetical protein